MKERILSISEAAKQLGVETHVLRYWEEELDIEVPRNEMGHRLYGAHQMQLLHSVKELKMQGFQLRAIKLLLHEWENGEQPDINQIVAMREEINRKVEAMNHAETSEPNHSPGMRENGAMYHLEEQEEGNIRYNRQAKMPEHSMAYREERAETEPETQMPYKVPRKKKDKAAYKRFIMKKVEEDFTSYNSPKVANRVPYMPAENEAREGMTAYHNTNAENKAREGMTAYHNTNAESKAREGMTAYHNMNAESEAREGMTAYHNANAESKAREGMTAYHNANAESKVREDMTAYHNTNAESKARESMADYHNAGMENDAREAMTAYRSAKQGQAECDYDNAMPERPENARYMPMDYRNQPAKCQETYANFNQFQYAMLKVMNNVLQENTTVLTAEMKSILQKNLSEELTKRLASSMEQVLGDHISDEVSTRVIKELNYLTRMQEEREEAYFQQLNGVLGIYQESMKECASAKQRKKMKKKEAKLAAAANAEEKKQSKGLFGWKK